ncbi:MAG: HAMP domain-containing histidine kinase [Prevotellaceae bacterium]|nr:HAMP domain-containing histidine kinase [Prevotellaceae bacterium]
MNKRLIVLLAIAISISTLTVVGIQIKWIRATADAAEEAFSRNVQATLQQVVDIIVRQEIAQLFSDSIPVHFFQSRFSSYPPSHADRPVTERVTDAQIDSLLRKELRRKNIVAPYEFAITDEWGAIVLATAGFSNARPEHTYNAALFPSDPYHAPHYFLNIYLPPHRDYIMYSIRWMLVASGVLILVICATFAVTLMTVFRQKRLSKIRNDFVNNITHELKTPIATISLASEILQDHRSPRWQDRVPRLSQVIHDESERLMYLVEKVLQTAIYSRGKLKLKVEEVDIHDIIRKVLADFSLQFETLHITTESRFLATNPHVMADALHLAHVLTNMIDNAIQYRKTTEPLHIVVQTRNTAHSVEVAVSDNGIGVDERQAKQVFNPFYRYVHKQSPPVKGFGLGLYYVKNIIETHHGKLFVSGAVGKGSTFGFELPVRKRKRGCEAPQPERQSSIEV